MSWCCRSLWSMFSTSESTNKTLGISYCVYKGDLTHGQAQAFGGTMTTVKYLLSSLQFSLSWDQGLTRWPWTKSKMNQALEVGSVTQDFSSVQSLSRIRLFATPWIAARQATLSITNSQSLLKLMSIKLVMPSHPLSSPSPPAPSPSQHQGLFQWVSSSHQVAKVLVFQLQHQSFQWTPRAYLLYDGLVGSPCSPRDSQESSPTPQFKSISFSALSFLSTPILTSIHDHWKNYSLD